MELWREGRALKASLRGEGTSLKVAGSHHQLQVQVQVVSDEKLTRASSTEDFSVECFLDFSQDRRLLLHEESQENKLLSLSSSSSQEQEQDFNFASQACVFDQFPSFPDEDVEELEWVSRVVDDSSSSQELSLLFTQNKPQQLNKPHKPKPQTLISSPIPVKPRTKRPRNSLTVPKHWPLFSSQEKPATTAFQRRCSHCGTNNTPQWRSGPLGPKTLCNACGVRFKSGRLCPEYRPADSPSFSNQIHSNVHRKVLELRKSKELGESREQNKSNLAAK